MTLLDDITSGLEEQLYTTIQSKFGKAIADGARLYVPALRRMGIQELSDYISTLTDKTDLTGLSDKARKYMTDEELVTEKEQLAVLTAAMASDNAKKAAAARQMLTAIQKAAIAVILSAAGL